MNYGKKYLALALALLMVFSILPVSAFAEEVELIPEEIEEILPVEEIVEEVPAVEEAPVEEVEDVADFEAYTPPKFGISYASADAENSDLQIRDEIEYGATTNLRDEQLFEQIGYHIIGWIEGTEDAYVDELGEDAEFFALGGEFTAPEWTDKEPLKDLLVYPVWEVNEYTVAFDANGGDPIQNFTTTKIHFVPLDLTAVVPEKDYIQYPPTRNDGFAFIGWDEDKNATDPTYPWDPADEDYVNTTAYAVEANTTLYAIWEEAPYTVEYVSDDTDGITTTNMPNPQAKKYGVDLEIATEIPVKKADPEEVQITLNANIAGNLKGTDVDQFVYRSTVRSTNYPFLRWVNLAEDDMNHYYGGLDGQGDKYYKLNEDATLHAIWDDAELVVDPVALDWEPQRTGYTFLGWSRTITNADEDVLKQIEDAEDVLYEVGENFIPELDEDEVTLYGVWVADTLTITYDANGGKIDGADTAIGVKFFDQDYTIGKETSKEDSEDIPDPTRASDFANFTVTLDYNLPEKYKIPADWPTEIKGNGKKNVAPYIETAYTWTETWDIDPEGNGVDAGYIYKNGDSYKENEDLVIYAIWNPAETLNNTVALPTPAGPNFYTFHGWVEEIKDEYVDEDYVDPAAYVVESDITLHAVWDIEEVKVIYNISSDEVEYVPDPRSEYKEDPITIDGVTVDTEYTLIASAPVVDGYVFLGWEVGTGKDSGFVELQPGDTIIPSHYLHNETLDDEHTINLYGVWAPATWTITYDANGGENAPVDKKVYAYQEQATIKGEGEDAPTREGYTFVGWTLDPKIANVYDALILPGSKYPAEGEAPASAEVTLYAVWTDKYYPVIYLYDFNDKDDVYGEQLKVYGKPLMLLQTTPTREGYAFLGWSYYNPTNLVDFLSGDIFDIDPETPIIYLSAVWAKGTYSVMYDANGGEGAPNGQATKTIDGEEVVTLRTEIPTRTGFTFIGWNTRADGLGMSYEPGKQYVIKDTDVINGVMRLYAIWSEDEYTVTYKYDGEVPENASDLPETKTYKLGETVTVAEDANAIGYTFSGWSMTGSFVITENVEITGSFTANGDTVYKVEHVLVDVDGVATVAETEEKTAETGANVVAYPKEFEGYVFDEEKSVTSGVVAGDGSLVLTLYYAAEVQPEPEFPNEKLAGFVERCYTKALARESDPMGLRYWYHVLEDGQLTAEQVGTYFVFSPEGAQKGQNTNDFLTMLYRLYMDREPEAEGLAYWTELLDNGTLTREQVNDYFGASPEFQAIKAEYGLAAK